jgi:hypothetical protein
MSVDLPVEGGIDTRMDILPIFYCREVTGSDPVILAFAGTGFRFGSELVVTCWHCVKTDADGHGYAAAFAGDDREYVLNPLLDLTRDANGADLASGRLFEPQPNKWPLRLTSQNVAGGADVCTFGYPLTEERLTDSGRAFTLHGRYLEGYVTRSFWYEHPTEGRVPTYEVDMPAPEGLSGAPLLSREGGVRPEVLGVIYGRIEASLIDEFASIDPDTGERRPEVQRLVSFLAAHYSDTLAGLTGPATADQPLATYLAGLSA